MTTQDSGVPAVTPHNFTISYPSALPIVGKRDEIVAALLANQVIIIAGETGSGKTTQIPKMCLEAGLGIRGKIGCTQPRRIAALSVSRRLAQELGVTWGHEVGCKIRFTDHTKPQSRIKVMTDGILLAEIRSDPDLRAYEAIILDEAHERSLNIDFLLGYLKGLLARRSDLKLIITSATIDTELFSRAFNNAPVFQVSGRLFPVDIRYRSLSSFDDEDELSYVQAASEAVGELIEESRDGDILVFMPTERDIRETCELLQEKHGRDIDILLLMGSLSAAEQERVFAPSEKRKVIVATNIAETSLTIPGIRFVVDSGFARISRYQARQRVKRLPVERIAQSNANQRAGRAGRVEAGVCVRLYGQDDFDARPLFSEPELLRANLAEVILRMKAYNLGEIDSFPFLNPPDHRAIQAGFALLHELGALDEQSIVSQIGIELARIPVDPTIGRMLLQARREGCLPEIVVIAAALSIQDPRERSPEIREKADRAHRVFVHPDSDFLTLLSIWSQCSREIGPARSKSALRKFCKTNFLSFIRMREWGDLITELGREMKVDLSSLPEPGTIKRFDGRYRAIHRSILSGFIGQVAYRRAPNSYRGTASREIQMWPGSALAERVRAADEHTFKERKRRPSRKEQWIVSSELVETSKLFARNNAYIVASWIEELSRHLTKRNYIEPRWCSERRAVIAEERVTLYGMLLSSRRVFYGRYNPEEARDIFIENVLLSPAEGNELPNVSNNRAIANKAAMVLASQGRLNREELEERFARFYRERLPLVSSEQEFIKYSADRAAQGLPVLTVSFEDLVSDVPVKNLDEQFPDSIAVAGQQIRVWYTYAPGSESDGVTLEIPQAVANSVTPELLDGLIPGLRERQVLHLLHELPRDLRKQLGPLAAAAERIAHHTTMKKLPLIRAVREILHHDFALQLPVGVIASSTLPDHLRPHIKVREQGAQLHCQSPINPTGLVKSSSAVDNADRGKDVWNVIRTEWEKENISTWECGDLPEAVKVGMLNDVPIVLYPTLRCEGDRIAIRLVDSREEALESAYQGQRALAERVLAKDIAELRKQAKDLERLRPQLTLWRPIDEVKKDVLQCALNHLLDHDVMYPLTQSEFGALVQSARDRMPNLIARILETLKSILELRKSLLQRQRVYQGMRSDLEALVPFEVLVVTSLENLRQIPRYLRTMALRCERMDTNPSRYEQCTRQIRAYEECLLKLPPQRRIELRWMLEELKVSFFAQELGTQYPISVKRIDTWLAMSVNASGKAI